MWFNALVLASLVRVIAPFELTPSSRHFQEAVSGSTVKLNCTLAAVVDRPSLVLWYRDYSTKPFYSFDAREQAGSARHKVHQDWRHLGDRTNFTFRPGVYTKQAAVVGSLTLANVSLEDAGNYTCRVDFHTAQTAMTLVTLSVIEGVRRLSVVDGDGREVGGEAGPYMEGQTLRLLCTASGGHPPPMVVWMMDGKPVPRDSDSIFRTFTQDTKNLDHDSSNYALTSNSKLNESRFVTPQILINSSDSDRSKESMYYETSSKKKRYVSDGLFAGASKVIDAPHRTKVYPSLPLHRHLHFSRSRGSSGHISTPYFLASVQRLPQKRYLQFPPIRLKTHRSLPPQESLLRGFYKNVAHRHHGSYSAAWQSNLHKMTYFSPPQDMSRSPSISRPLVTKSELSSLKNLSSPLQPSSKSNWSEELLPTAASAAYEAMHPPGAAHMSNNLKNSRLRPGFVASVCPNATLCICKASPCQKCNDLALFVVHLLSNREASLGLRTTKETTEQVQADLLVIALKGSSTDATPSAFAAESCSKSCRFNASCCSFVCFSESSEEFNSHLQSTCRTLAKLFSESIGAFENRLYANPESFLHVKDIKTLRSKVSSILNKVSLTTRLKEVVLKHLNACKDHFNLAYPQVIIFFRFLDNTTKHEVEAASSLPDIEVLSQKLCEAFHVTLSKFSHENESRSEMPQTQNFKCYHQSTIPISNLSVLNCSIALNCTLPLQHTNESSNRTLISIFSENMSEIPVLNRRSNSSLKYTSVSKCHPSELEVGKESVKTLRKILPLSRTESSPRQLEDDFKIANVASTSYRDSKQTLKLKELHRKHESRSLETNYKQKSEPRTRGNLDSKKAINSKFHGRSELGIIWPTNASSDVVPEIPAKKRVSSVDVRGLPNGLLLNSTRLKSKSRVQRRNETDLNGSVLRFPFGMKVKSLGQDFKSDGNSKSSVVTIEKKSADRVRRADGPRLIEVGNEVKKRLLRAGRVNHGVTGLRQSAEEEVTEKKVTASLHIGPLTREDNDKVFTCRADNSHLTKPKTRLVKVTMILPPMGVTIITPTVGGLAGVAGVVGVMAGREGVLVCRGEGSIPPAVITWSPSSLVTPLSSQPTMDSKATVSRARILATAKDDGRVVTCTATNPQVSHYSVTATHALQVKYPPEVNARLAPALDPHSIKEGDDVYFECDVHANPPAATVQWIHRDTVLQAGDRGNLSRVILHGRSLVLQGVTRLARGPYSCRATNALGSVTSSPVMLNVMYPPVCRDPPNQTIAIAPGQRTTLVCRVDSYPKQVRFRWAVNTSRGLAHVDPSRYRSKETSSYLVYKPQISLSQEAEERRKTYYMSQKRGFHATDSSNSNRAAGFITNSFVESENEKRRKTRTAGLENLPVGENLNGTDVRGDNFQDFVGYDEMKALHEGKKNWFDLEKLVRSEDQKKLKNFVSDSKENLNYLTSEGAKSPGLTPFVDESKFATPTVKNSPNPGSPTSPPEEGDLGLEETYGVVYCWGENAQGKQQQPCVITVTPAGPPSPIRNCRIRNQTATALQVLCRPGADGGLKQTFVAVVRDERTGEVAGNTSSPHPLLTLPGLTAGTGYIVQVWTYNARGASKPFLLEGHALKVAENKIDHSQTMASGSHKSVLFAASLAGCALVLACLLGALRLRRRRRARPPRSESDDAPKTSVSDNEGEEEDVQTEADDRQKRESEACDRPSCGGPDLLMRTDSSAVPLFSHFKPHSPPLPVSSASNTQSSSLCLAQSKQIHLCDHYSCDARAQPPAANMQSNFQHHQTSVQRPHTPSIYSQTQFLVLGQQNTNGRKGFLTEDTVLGSSPGDKSTKRRLQKQSCDGCNSTPPDVSCVDGSEHAAYCQLPPHSSVPFNFQSMPPRKGQLGQQIPDHRSERDSSKKYCECAPSVSASNPPLCNALLEKNVRQPSFQYATICRSFALASSEEALCAKTSQRFLARGLSSHELLPKGSLEPGNLLDSRPKLCDTKCGTVDDAELEVSRRRSTACEDAEKSLARVWTHGSGPCHENKSDRDGSCKESKSRNCRVARPGMTPALGSASDKGSTDHTQISGKNSSLNKTTASPLQSVSDLPKVKRESHQYYTLKVSNARQNSESFV